MARKSNQSYIEVVNWAKAQPRMKGAGQAWFKIYTSLLTHEGFARLDPTDQLGLVAIWMVAAWTGKAIQPADGKWLMRKADFLRQGPNYVALAAACDDLGRPTPFVRLVADPAALAASADRQRPKTARRKTSKTKTSRHRKCACGATLPARRRVCDNCKQRRHGARSTTPSTAARGPLDNPVRSGTRTAGPTSSEAARGPLDQPRQRRNGNRRTNPSSVGIDGNGNRKQKERERERAEQSRESRNLTDPGPPQTAVTHRDFTDSQITREPEKREQRDQRDQTTAEQRQPTRTRADRSRESEFNLTESEAPRAKGFARTPGPSVSPIGHILKLWWGDVDSVRFAVAICEALYGISICDLAAESETVKATAGAFAAFFLKQVKTRLRRDQYDSFREKAVAKVPLAIRKGRPPGKLLMHICVKMARDWQVANEAVG